ncbi:hypothetical protein DVH24_018337 [Malus domestica]|uniref:TIR domain-containing protein n=1 Tax=Malus domestica TaxID=3750 RepID=A0A498KKK3_MALDO|nr:hypothetical protein DVH24_018337 [Malus domestica]
MNNQLVSSSFSSPPSWKYDVFLSFRGVDTRTNFTDHFYKALDDKAITTFIDHQLKRGEEISQALLEAIDESRISIIIFSKNYASSRWCLEELVRILECRKSRKQIVLPVFYKVDPSHVRKQTSSFGDAFTEKFKFEDNKEKILTWRSALRDAANLTGYTFKEGGYEATFISKIGTKKIRGIVVELPKPDVITLNAESFLGMENLEIFINRNAQFSGHVDYLPNDLRWIELGGRSNIYQKHTVVFNLSYNHQPRHLVKFDVSYSGVRQLKGFKNLPKLIYINLNGCEFLEKIPNLSGSPNITHLYLRGCISLVEIDDSVGFLDKLVLLDLSGCSKLTKFVTRLGLRSLKELSLFGCRRLERFPEIEESMMESVWSLNIQESGIRKLPSSIASLTRLQRGKVNGWENGTNIYLCGGPKLITAYLDILDDQCIFSFPNLDYHPRHLIMLDVSYSGINQLNGYKLTWINLSGCKFLEKIPDLSGSPNIRTLILNDCTSLVEVGDSVGFLDKLQLLELSGCSKLTRFATRLGSRSLWVLNLGGCRRLESFPEIEGKMESLFWLDIEKTGIRELPSIAYFTGLQTLKASGCELQNIQLLPFGKKVKFDEVLSCRTQKLMFPYLEGCNLSERDFLVPLDCWSALTDLYLSRNNFVSLPDCFSAAVNLKTLYLRDCKRLQEIPVLPPKLESLHLDGCTSLEKIPKLPPRLRELSLCNCFGLSGDEVAKLENNLLNEEIDPCSQLNIIYPGNEISKWFSYTSNHPTIIQPIPEHEWKLFYEDEEFVGGSEFRFEIPLKLQVGDTLLGLALSFVLEPSTCYSHDYSDVNPFIFINGELMCELEFWYAEDIDIKATHVRLALVGLEAFDGFWSAEDMDICQSKSPSDSDVPFDIEDDEEQLHLPLRPTSSLGKRPRPRGSSDIVDDEYDQQQQWLSSSSEPADDHPIRRVAALIFHGASNKYYHILTL